MRFTKAAHLLIELGLQACLPVLRVEQAFVVRVVRRAAQPAAVCKRSGRVSLKRTVLQARTIAQQRFLSRGPGELTGPISLDHVEPGLGDLLRHQRIKVIQPLRGEARGTADRAVGADLLLVVPEAASVKVDQIVLNADRRSR